MNQMYNLLLSSLPQKFDLQPSVILGIFLALAGSVLVSFGTQYQSRGVSKTENLTSGNASKGLNKNLIRGFLSRPSWVFGTLMLGSAVGVQILSLSFAPLIVVQPLGVVALIITSVLNAKISKIKLPRQTKIAITMCVLGIVAFVMVAALTAEDTPVQNAQLVFIIVLFAVVTTLLLIIFALVRHSSPLLFYIIGTGVLYGFVVTFAKTVLSKFQTGTFDFLTIVAFVCLVIGMLLGMMFVQNAHSAGPPDLIIAGLTVIDPIVAITIGITVLGEASRAPLWAFVVFVIAGLIAVAGVFAIAKFHPQAKKQVD